MVRSVLLVLVSFLSASAANGRRVAVEHSDQDSQTDQVPADADSAEISGTVLERETKFPVPGAVVTLCRLGVTQRIIVPLGSAPPMGQQATTDADGDFTFPDAANGKYLIRVEKAGHAPALYGSNPELGEASVVQVANGRSVRGLRIYLGSGGRIGGRVTTREDVPVGNAEVTAYWKAFSQGVARLLPGPTSATNVKGEYEMADVAPGSYYLFVRPQLTPSRRVATANAAPRESGVVCGFYPAGAPLAATPMLRVEPGMRILDADVRLREVPAYRVQGKVSLSVSENAHLVVQLREWSAEAALGPLLSSQVASPPAYRFEFGAVPAGRYTVAISKTSEPRSLLSTETLDVSRDVPDLELAAAGGISVSGAIRADSSSPGASNFDAERLSVRITNVDIPETPAVETGVSKDGSFTVAGLATGRSVF